MFIRKKYHIVYTVQNSITDVSFKNRVIDINPVVWINSKRGDPLKYSLINWFEMDDDTYRRMLITYVTQSTITDFSFKTEIVSGNPYAWIRRKNAESSIAHTLINWTTLA